MYNDRFKGIFVWKRVHYFQKGSANMISQSTLFLFILLIIGLIAKNQSLTVAIGVLFLLKFTFLGDKVFPYLQTKGINLGVTVITIAVLVPIATGEIGFKQLGEAAKSYYAWIALASGVAVALLAKVAKVQLLTTDLILQLRLFLGRL